MDTVTRVPRRHRKQLLHRVIKSNSPWGRVKAPLTSSYPTGLTLASELLRRDIRIRIIEKTEAQALTSRALGVQSRTLEIFEDMGIVDEVLAKGVPVADGIVYDMDKPLLKFNWNHLKGEPYPFALVIPQNGTEHALNDLVIRRGARWNAQRNC